MARLASLFARLHPSGPAWRAWHDGDVGAVDSLAGALAESPEKASLMFLACYVRGHYERALDWHVKVGQGHRGRDQVHLAAVDACLHLGRWREARELAERRLGAGRIPADLRLRYEKPLEVSLDRTCVLPFAEHELAEWHPHSRRPHQCLLQDARLDDRLRAPALRVHPVSRSRPPAPERIDRQTGGDDREAEERLPG